MLVSCVAYASGKKLADIPVENIQEYVKRPDCFVWVALADPEKSELERLQDAFDLHPLAIEDAHLGHQRPKIEEYGDAMFAVLHVVERGEEELNVGELAIFAGPNYVLSMRKRVSKGFSEVRARAEREPELLAQGSGYIFYALMDAVVDRYFPVIDVLEQELELIEERIFDRQTTPRTNIELLYEIKQRTLVMKHAVAPLLESVSNLTGGRVPALCARITEYYRDIYDHLMRLDQTIDSLRETISTAISVNLVMITLQDGETMKRLAAYASLLAVPTMIAGIYGMNFEHMPELKWTYGYPLVMAVMVGIDVVLWLKLRKARWL